MKESRIRIKNRYSIETSNVGKIGWTRRMGREDGKGWRLKRIGRVRDRRKRNGAERQAWYEAIASGSVLHRGRDTRCTTRARNAFQRRVSESVEQVYARESIYPVHILLQVPGVQETIGIHRVELVTPK